MGHDTFILDDPPLTGSDELDVDPVHDPPHFDGILARNLDKNKNRRIRLVYANKRF
jgi:hypothetical protein